MELCEKGEYSSTSFCSTCLVSVCVSVGCGGYMRCVGVCNLINIDTIIRMFFFSKHTFNDIDSTVAFLL